MSPVGICRPLVDDDVLNKVSIFRYQYKSEKMKVTQIEILQDILRTKGVTYLWHGFFPYFIRLSLHTILTFILMNELSQRYIKHYQPTKT